MVSARKSPASGCELGTVLATSVRYGGGSDGPQVIHCPIRFSADGVSIEQTWNTTALRATGSHTVVLDKVFVPDAAVALVRPADVWHPIWNVVLGSAMPLIMAAYLGAADAAVGIAIRACAGRLASDVDRLVGEMGNAHTVDVFDAMFRSTDNLRFANTDTHTVLTLSRKTVASSALRKTVEIAVEIVGGQAFSRGHDPERLARDVQGSQFHPLPRAAQLTLSGRVAGGSAQWADWVSGR